MKTRAAVRIVSVAVIIAVGVNTDGQRQVRGMKVGASAAEPFSTEILRELTRRGLRGVKLAISDSHVGIKTAIATAFAQDSATAAHQQWRVVAEHLRERLPTVGELMDGAEHEVLAYMDFPRAHWLQIRFTSPLERLNAEIKRRTDVVGISECHVLDLPDRVG